MTWAAQVIGREEYGYRWGSTRDEAIDAAVAAELDRRECDDDEPGPIRLEVHGGCKWQERSEDEHVDDEQRPPLPSAETAPATLRRTRRAS